MADRTLLTKVDKFLHGGDYNPDQWINYDGIWDEDMRLMKLSHCNAMSVGIFSWAALEPEEGKFEFGWLDTIMDKIAENDGYAVLATPTGARPAWMSFKYPEVLRVRSDQHRNTHGVRHNHCYTSPVYREKTEIINTKLAERYKDHPALILWHLSNEYGGECFCDLCQEEFRSWLFERYKTLNDLNEAWWTRFWAHTYTDWSQIEAPMPHGEMSVLGQRLDWRRFCTDRHVDFCSFEASILKKITPEVPTCTNLMGFYPGIDYRKLAKVIDVVSWDNYPRWHGEQPDHELAAFVGMVHDMNRSLKKQPFLLMESVPSATNWMQRPKRKRPGMHKLSSLQAVAHGSDSVQYFQWRKGRGSAEQHHGAVVDHAGHENTRVFKDVTDLGIALEKIQHVVGTATKADVAVIVDWDVMWAVGDCAAIAKDKKNYIETCTSHYSPFWKHGISVDCIGEDDDFEDYKLLIAPMMYLLREGVGQRIEKFVENGGTFVTTYWSGIVNDSTLAFLGGFPGPLKKVMGIWAEEIDTLYDSDSNSIEMKDGNELGLKGGYKVHTLCDLIHTEGAQVLGEYGSDFYRGRPALTVNKAGKGQAFYIAARTEQKFLHDFYTALMLELKLEKNLDIYLPEGVTVQRRTDGEKDYLFIMNFSSEPNTLELDGQKLKNLETGEDITGEVELAGYGILIAERQRG